jgi:hypothetical protein
MSINDYASLLPPPNVPHGSSPNLAEASLDSMEHFFGMLVPDGDFAAYPLNFPIAGSLQDGDSNYTELDGQRDYDTVGSPTGSLADAEPPRGTRHDAATGGDGMAAVLALAGTEALISLSRLNESVSRQLAKINSYPWQAPPLMQSVCSAKINSTTDNPVAEALQSTTSFVSILKSLLSPGTLSTSDSGISVMGSSRGGGGGISSEPGTVTPHAPCLSTVTYLLLLSSYLQLMQLYDTMFCRVVDFLGDRPEEAMGEFHAQPELRVAGLPAMPPRLYIKLLIQIIDHQLESVECLMGLSSEYRISGRATTGKGIFSDRDVSGLFQTVMGQADNSKGPGSITTGKSLVLSLRENMARVLEVLHC